ncbi:hypothetical protein H2203_000580 [Taxawa tesnikishii (nom. ined.)]|nr:hypothetical protein H2203_000580 [Dothideales sp. JES 119]
MRTNNLLSAAALAGLAAASPAAQQLDFAALAAAPSVQAAPSYNGVPNQAASVISTVDVTTTATASAAPTTAASKRSASKRSVVEKRDLLTWLYCLVHNCNTSSGSSSSGTASTSSRTTTTSSVTAKTLAAYSSSSASAPVTTSVSIPTYPATATDYSTPTTSPYTPYYAALSTSGHISNAALTGTATTSSAGACATTPEEGTYCGFLNPEDPCAPQPDGYGPVPSPDTVDAFYNYVPFHAMASSAPKTIVSASKSGVQYQQTFLDLNASSSAQSYLAVYTFQTYDTLQCASLCDATPLCTAFNMYIERDPSQAPSANDSTAPTVWGYWCPNPASMTSYKCSLWGSNLDASTATNYGQNREQFQIVITGSNGYDATNSTTPPTCSAPVSSSAPTSTAAASKTSSSAVASATATGTGSSGFPWSKPQSCGGKAINAGQYWMGSKFFPGPFNPQVCADYARQQSALNKAQAVAKGVHSYTPCNMFNAYYLHKNSVPHGTYCALYDSDVSTSYATYSGGFSGNDHYECKQSWKYTLSSFDDGKC